MNDSKINEVYQYITEMQNKYLKKYGVVLPNLKKKGKYTKDALTLVYLAQGYPDTKVISKKELTEFIQKFYPDVLDVQQARHLGVQKGWFILSGTRKDNSSESIKPGEYKLESLEKCYPGFTAERRIEVAGDDYWEELKKKYGKVV